MPFSLLLLLLLPRDATADIQSHRGIRRSHVYLLPTAFAGLRRERRQALIGVPVNDHGSTNTAPQRLEAALMLRRKVCPGLSLHCLTRRFGGLGVDAVYLVWTEMVRGEWVFAPVLEDSHEF